MKLWAKRVICTALAVLLVCTAFAGCSKSTDALDENVDVVDDVDDSVKVNMLLEDEADTFELTDKQGNVLTLVPIYGCDGTTMIACYVFSVKDSSGNGLDQTAYPNLKAVLMINQENEEYSLVYDDNDALVTIDAQSDEDGLIVAIQDKIDYDGDKDTEEYFKVTTKLDSTSHLFIKLDSEDNKTPINVTVEKNSDGTSTVTDSEGNKTTTTSTTQAKSLKDVVEEDKKQKEEESQGSTGEDPSTPSTPEETLPTVDGYTVIVLSSNGQVKTNASNVTVDGSILSGGTEVHITGGGDYNKYYITSEVDTFVGQVVLQLHVEDDVEIKFNNVNIVTQKKTAVKFVNLDAVEDKESDTESTGTDLGTIGSSLTNSAAPRVELSITGTNSFQANGSGKNGTIYSECKLAIKGHGTADIDGGSALSGICSTESITIKNATLNITSSAKQGISCDKKVLVNSGATINIESKGDCIHCNKFELDGVDADGVSANSVVTLSSLYSTECADGIDADNEIIIDGGTLDVTALTSGKYALKVRKVLKGASNGYFEINGGSVTASGSLMTTPTSCTQKTVVATSSSATTFTAGKYSSSSDATAFLVSPSAVNAVSASGTKATVSWNSSKTIGTATF